ncbi:MAG: molybdate ABC transporter substrate-binding protein [Planctomycetota bacterium]|nr:molybdate ABC transporter substrate-binding protein [Planctomycetota bacterium]
MPHTPATARRTRTAASVAGLVAILAGCAGDRRPAVRIFAAASLTAPFEQLAARFSATRPDLRVELHCAGTPQLVMQLRQGAPADVFASADQLQMRAVVDAGLTADEPRRFASNSLAIVTQPDNPKAIRSVEDLARPGVTCLLCAPQVPAGRYAREMMQRAGVAARSASDEPSVRAVVSKVELGVADAGVVYRSDALAAAARVHDVPIPARLNVEATYPIVTVSTGVQPTGAHEFVAFVLSGEGRRILSEHGFSSP